MYTPPTGYKSLCTTNLTDPTIADGSKYFDAKIFTGDGSAKTVTGYQFEPDMVWLKNRSISAKHEIVDAVRGVNSMLFPSNTQSESTSTLRFTSFNSDGFTIGTGSNSAPNGNSNVGWAWDAGTTTVTNNSDGSITPTGLRANPSAGFSVVTYNGTGSNATFGHGLNAAPELVIVKSRSDAQNWAVQHSALGPTYYGYLQSTTEFRTTSGGPFWNNTAPTSSVVNVGTDNDTNASGKTYVAYCFAPVAGYSSISSYTSTGGDCFVYTGFRPAFLMVKKVTASADNSYEGWVMFDSKRGDANIVNETLFANKIQEEGKRGNGGSPSNSNFGVDLLSNGFMFKTNASEYNRADSSAYIYYAVAENPFKTARAR